MTARADAAAPVLVAVSADPETSHRANEAIRIALGILAGENPVVIALLGAGAKILDAEVEDYTDGEDIARHVATFRKLRQPFHVERAAISYGRGWNPAGLQIVPLDGADLARLMATSRRVLVF